MAESLSWPRRCGSLYPSPHSWTLPSVSDDSSPRSHLRESPLDWRTRTTTSKRFDLKCFRVFFKYRPPRKASFYNSSLEKLALLSLVKEVNALSRSQNDITSTIWYLVSATSTVSLKLVVEWRRLPRFPPKWRWFTREHYSLLRKSRTRSRTRLRI